MRRTLVAVAASAALAGLGSVSAAFSTTTDSPGNQVSSGSVTIDDDSSATSPMFVASRDGNLAPGESAVRCVRVSYTGSLEAQVKLYARSSTLDAAAFDVTVERGSGMSHGAPRCTGFTPSSTAFGPARADTFPFDYAGGVFGRDGGTTWTTGTEVDYRVTLTARDDATENGRETSRTTGDSEFVFEARSV